MQLLLLSMYVLKLPPLAGALRGRFSRRNRRGELLLLLLMQPRRQCRHIGAHHCIDHERTVGAECTLKRLLHLLWPVDSHSSQAEEFGVASVLEFEQLLGALV